MNLFLGMLLFLVIASAIGFIAIWIYETIRDIKEVKEVQKIINEQNNKEENNNS